LPVDFFPVRTLRPAPRPPPPPPPAVRLSPPPFIQRAFSAPPPFQDLFSPSRQRPPLPVVLLSCSPALLIAGCQCEGAFNALRHSPFLSSNLLFTPFFFLAIRLLHRTAVRFASRQSRTDLFQSLPSLGPFPNALAQELLRLSGPPSRFLFFFRNGTRWPLLKDVSFNGLLDGRAFFPHT